MDCADGFPQVSATSRVFEDRKKVPAEAVEVLEALRVKRTRELVGGEIEPRVTDRDPFVQLGQKNDPSHRRLGRRDEKSVIPPRVGSTGGGTGVPAKAVGFKPL